jgi:protein dithiol oxidoreductase (disulfide-forming)
MSIDVARITRLASSVVAASLLLAIAVPTAWAQGPAIEGRQYVRINPVPVETGKKIEVIEFFSYGCPHCAEFEPYLQTWVKAQGADVAFRRIPVMFQPRWADLAKAYYTLEAMGEDSRLSPEVFTAIHSKGLALWEPAKFYDWAATKGLDRKKVEDLYTSFAISGRVSRAMQLAQAYNIQEVPTVVIDGKFITSGARSGSHAATPAVMTELVAKARAERPKS